MFKEVALLADILTGRCSPEQLQGIVEDISASIIDGRCPICGTEEIPIDKEGNEIKGNDVSNAFQWREQHDYDECIIPHIEQHLASLSKRNATDLTNQ